MLREVGQFADAMIARVMNDAGENFFVRAFFVAHHQDAERAAVDQTTRKRRMGADHEDVERVAVRAHRPGNPAVVEGVEERRVERTVQLEDAQFRIELVLVRRAARNLDDRIDLLGRVRADGQGLVGVGSDEGRRRGIRHNEVCLL